MYIYIKIFSILITVKDRKSIWQIYNDEVIHIFKCYHVIVLSDIKEKLFFEIKH